MYGGTFANIQCAFSNKIKILSADQQERQKERWSHLTREAWEDDDHDVDGNEYDEKFSRETQAQVRTSICDWIEQTPRSTGEFAEWLGM